MKLVVASSNIKGLIDVYLDQMIVRAGQSVNNALDKALVETGHGLDGRIYELKKDVIDQAQEMFRPLAKSILMDSSMKRLQKRTQFHKRSFFSSFRDDFSRSDPDFEDPTGEIHFNNIHILDEAETADSQRSNSLFADSPAAWGNSNFDNHDVDPLETRPHYNTESSLFADSPAAWGNSNLDNHYVDPLETRPHYNTESSLFEDSPAAWGNSNLDNHYVDPLAQPSSPIPPRKKSFKDLLKYNSKNYRPESWSNLERMSNDGPVNKGVKTSWNMQLSRLVRKMITTFLAAWKSVLEKINIFKFTDSIGDKFSDIFHSETARTAGLVVVGIGLAYIVYCLFFKREKADDHDYFE